MQQRQKKSDVARIVFWASLVFVIFLVGGEFAKRGWQPYQMFEDGYKAAKALINQALRTRPFIVEKSRYDGDGVTRHDPARAYQGITLIQGWFAEGTELRLIDMEGNLVHRWQADFFSIWPKPAHIFPPGGIPVTRFNYDIQGMWLFPDGSVMLNFRHHCSAPGQCWANHTHLGRGVAVSNDGGDTFGSVLFDARLPDPTCQGSIVSFNGATYFCNSAGPGRSHLTIPCRWGGGGCRAEGRGGAGGRGAGRIISSGGSGVHARSLSLSLAVDRVQ